MQAAGVARLSHPSDVAGCFIPMGGNLLEMAGSAGDRQVCVVGDCLVMTRVALAAVGRLLARVFIPSCLRVTRQTRHVRVRPESARPHVNDRQGGGLGRAGDGAIRPVAGKTQGFRVLNSTGSFKIHPAVAAHAAFIICGEFRQTVLRFMAAAALTRRRPGRIKRSPLANPQLGMRIVAVTAAPIVLLGLQRLATVPPGLQFDRYRIMTAGAWLRLKPATGRLVHVGRVWVQRLFGNFAVAVQAHDLPMRRNVPPHLIHQPIGASVAARADDGENR